jgi:serine/threonine protein kinase
MKTATPCPEHDELRQLIGGNLSDDRQQECVNHIDSCECCQSRLEEIATGGTNLSQVVEHLDEAEPAKTSAFWPALKAIDGELQAAAAPKMSGKSRDVSLHFLEPSTDSAYLGRLGHFDVMRILGRGGMGIVLEAFDSKLQRHVALKVLDPEVANDEVSRKRFCREARAAAAVTHENVVAVHQVEHSGDGDLPFLVMQLVAGESLEQRLVRDKRLPLREIVRIGAQAAHGLAAAHAQGLIHRDIKPGNILLEPPNDRVKLTDFGLARSLGDMKLTRTGFVTGTPLYMAPEQALGQEPDPRSDLFSLGAVLYELCTGQPPFKGDSALVILKQITEVKHRPLRELNPEIPDWLATTIDRLLEKKPENRIQTAAHLAELFDFEWALIKTTSEELPTVCRIEQARRVRRNRWIASIIGATFLAAGLFGGMWLSRHDGAAVEDVSSADPVAVLSANAGAVWSVAFDAKSETVAMAVEDGSLRLWDLADKSIKSTTDAHRGNIWSARFTPDQKHLATAGDDGLIKLWNLAEQTPMKVFEHPNAVRSIAISHDGQRLFAGDRAGGIRIWSIDGDKPATEVQQPGAVYAVALSANDETLASAGSDKAIRLWNAKGLTQKLLLEGHSGPVFGLSFHPDSRRLASVGWDKIIRVWDVRSGSLVKSWEGHVGDIWGVAYSPDGKKLATAGTDGKLKLWDAESGQLLGTYLGHKVGVHTIAFNSDGTLLASGGRDGAVRIWPIQTSVARSAKAE